MNIDVIGVPLDLGANRRGVDMGPSAVRYAGLEKAITKLGFTCRDMGNINAGVPENIDDASISASGMKYIKEVSRINSILSGMVSSSLLEGALPLVLGGDHSIAVGTILGAQSVKKNIGVLWIDAHGDFNSETTSLTGNLHGMSLAASTGIGALEMATFKSADVNFIDPKKVVLIGARSIDDGEAELIRKSGINVFTMTDIDMYGIRLVMERAINIVETGTNGFHLSFDMDAISPMEAPGVGTPVNGGLTFREAHLAAEMIALSKGLCSMEFVEINPILDNKNQTSELAVSLITSVLGKRII